MTILNRETSGSRAHYLWNIRSDLQVPQITKEARKWNLPSLYGQWLGTEFSQRESRASLAVAVHKGRQCLHGSSGPAGLRRRGGHALPLPERPGLQLPWERDLLKATPDDAVWPHLSWVNLTGWKGPQETVQSSPLPEGRTDPALLKDLCTTWPKVPPVINDLLLLHAIFFWGYLSLL